MPRDDRSSDVTAQQQAHPSRLMVTRGKWRWSNLVRPVARISFGIGVTAIAIGSLLPAESVPAIANDRIEHFTAYLVLSLLGTWMFQTWRAIFMTILSLCALAVGLEICQSSVPGRSPEFADAVAGWLGAVSAYTLMLVAWLRGR
ncbi:VanZ family protein [Dongia deserti]|uniref:VanZ family protein n=1 Tax=Dongia deserti TaxID=2268030 RepID=UPI0013C4CB46|nr:VanZ family protein [Dongia deserti]